MRVLTFALLLAVAGPAISATPEHFQVRNTEDIVRVCSTPAGDEHYATAIAFCHGFGSGAYRYYEAATEAADRFVCPPTPTPSRADVLGGFLTWAKANPAFMSKPAVNSLFRYLGTTYPCNK